MAYVVGSFLWNILHVIVFTVHYTVKYYLFPSYVSHTQWSIYSLSLWISDYIGLGRCRFLGIGSSVVTLHYTGAWPALDDMLQYGETGFTATCFSGDIERRSWIIWLFQREGWPISYRPCNRSRLDILPRYRTISTTRHSLHSEANQLIWPILQIPHALYSLHQDNSESFTITLTGNPNEWACNLLNPSASRSFLLNLTGFYTSAWCNSSACSLSLHAIWVYSWIQILSHLIGVATESEPHGACRDASFAWENVYITGCVSGVERCGGWRYDHIPVASDWWWGRCFDFLLVQSTLPVTVDSSSWWFDSIIYPETSASGAK